MEYDLTQITNFNTANCNGFTNGTQCSKIYSSDSPTSSSISSNSSIKYSTQSMTPSKANNNQYDDSSSVNNQISSSTSLIFSTASQFHISQNDVVYYSRETMHLLAKFLAGNSNNLIFRSLYGYAPDNLAWLWAFLDWDTPIDVDQLPSQLVYQPFRATDARIGEDKLLMINKLFAEAPLVQYIYRGEIMIGDIYKFIEYVQSIHFEPVAKALFVLYFPRFGRYIDNDLETLMQAKLLRQNLPLIQKMDNMICSLIKSRYTNLDEYKDKIVKGNNLPSYIKSLLKENNFWLIAPLNQKFYQTALSTPLSLRQELSKLTCDNNLILNANNLIENLNLNNDDHVNVFDSNFESNIPNNFTFQDSSAKNTFDYLKYVNEGNKVNDDLDHISFDNNNNSINNNELDESDLFNNTTTTTTSSTKLSRYFKLNASPTKDYNQVLSNTTTPIKYNRAQSPSLLNPSIQAFTPKTPSNFNEYSLISNNSNNTTKQNTSVWSNESISKNGKKLNQSNLSLTPPPSAKFKTTPLNIATPTNNSHHMQTSECYSPNLVKSPLANYMKSKLNDQFNNNDQHLSTHYLKHQFYGSPINRLNHLKGTPHVSLKQQHHRIFNSNTELNSSRCSSPARSNIDYDDHKNNNNNHNRNRAPHIWSGRLSPKVYLENSIYSRKVFLGGLPWDVNQQNLVQILSKFGSVKLEIPGKDSKHPRVSCQSKTAERATPGYVYIIFEHESSVQRLLTECRKEIKNGGEHYYFTIIVPQQQINQMNKHQRGKAKEVEVIPWNQDDTSYVPLNMPQPLPNKIDVKSTIFVGALHGMLNAQGLAKVMTEVFGEVIHASLDTDKYKYPIGSGRVTFRNRQSYVKAIKSKFVTIIANNELTDPSPKFEKTIQIDPYLEEAKCCLCPTKSVYFCRNESCLDYYCESCWKHNHDMNTNTGEHLALSRVQSSTKTAF